jgi:hypothetical protein
VQDVPGACRTPSAVLYIAFFFSKREEKKPKERKKKKRGKSASIYCQFQGCYML